MLAGGVSILLGWFGIGYGFTCTSCYSYNTPYFCGGILLFIIGIVLFIIGTNTKSYEK